MSAWSSRGVIVLVGCVLAAQVACDDTLFAHGPELRTYTPDWPGVTAFLDDHCVTCHSPEGESTIQFPDDLAADLWLETGNYVVPGDPAASRLWRVVSDQLEPSDYEVMPLGNGPLPPTVVAHIEEWILAGAPTEAITDGDGDGYTLVDGDCDDSDDAVHPAAVEACDGVDNDCDAFTDEGLTVAGILDADGDGFGTGGQGQFCPDQVATVGGDCDDASAAVNPGAAEVCGDGVDNDCDTLIDDASATDASSWYADFDGDGAGDPDNGQTACSAPASFVADNTDCDDTDRNTHAGADERCNGEDNDCDVVVDEDAVDAPTWYRDIDRDSYGTDSNVQLACTQPNGFVERGGDCNDNDGRYNPGASETNCLDPNDYNCDGRTGTADGDGDGYGACEECNDASGAVYPGAPETCDGTDNDCDQIVDEDPTDAMVFFVDADNDEFGSSATVSACSEPPLAATVSGDCDDGDGLAYPGAQERCNGADDDCDGRTDEDGVGGGVYYQDVDGDGYGTPTSTMEACSPSSGWVDNADDCDDSSSAVNPGVTADTGNSIDDDCDGRVDEDHVSNTNYADVQAIWNGNCTDAGCHGTINPQEGMALIGDSWPNIVNVPSQQADALNRVEPYSPAESYLWLKLNDLQSTVSGGSGTAMPKGSGPFAGSLSNQELATIEAWILDGAPR